MNGKYKAVTVVQGTAVTDSWNQYVAPAAEALGYDLDGNLTSDGRWTYTWDGEGRLVQMASAANSPANPVENARRLVFSYDGLSRRVGKDVYETISGVERLTLREFYQYDGWNLVLTARQNNIAPMTTKRHAVYVWGPDIGSRPYGWSSWQKAGGVGGLLVVMDGVNSALAYDGVDYNGAAAGLGSPPSDPADDDYFPLMDRLGNVVGLRYAWENVYGDGLSAIVEYDAFGRELRSSGRAADIVPFHFSTKFTDSETGLNYYGYRFYDPVNGRWINRDPIEEKGEINIYSFILNSPLNYVDLLGQNPLVIGAGEAVGAGAALVAGWIIIHQNEQMIKRALSRVRVRDKVEDLPKCPVRCEKIRRRNDVPFPNDDPSDPDLPARKVIECLYRCPNFGLIYKYYPTPAHGRFDCPDLWEP